MTDPQARLATALADRYTIQRELGAGGMATVYLAHDLKHHRKVAVKVLRPDLAAALGPERFLREVTIAANLQHPHVLPLYDSGQADGFLYYVMPYVEGTSLREKLVREGELPIPEAVRILRDVADAIGYAHQHGVVHRDIKPENIMLSGRHALVTDFGVAKAVSEATGRQTLTTAGVALGTPTYMSPEQAAADPHTDHRADIYAFGVVAYELLAGLPPFVGATPQAVLAAHVTIPAPPVTNHRASIPPALAALVMRCLEKKPADRWQHAEELIPQLEAVLTPSGGMTPTATQPILAITSGRRRLRMAVSAAAMLVLAGLGWVAFQPGPTPPRLERLAVIPFENRTGNPGKDDLGAMVADWVTRGLVEARLAEVVPTDVVAAAVVLARKEPGEAVGVQVARVTGATKLVAGAYYAVGDSVRYQAELIDAAGGRALAAVPPITAGAAETMAAIDTLRQRVLGSLAMTIDSTSIWGAAAGQRSSPPSLEAYRLLVRSYEAFFRDLGEAERLARQALVADSSYMSAKIQLAIVLINQGNSRFVEADSILGWVESRSHLVAAGDRGPLDWVRAMLDGDREGAYRAFARDSISLGNGTGRLALGVAAMFSGRPREALQVFGRVEPLLGGMHLWLYTAQAQHLLGQHEAELSVLREGRQQFPRSLWLATARASALAALGRAKELTGLEEEARSQPQDWGGWSFGGFLLNESSEQAAHGDSAGALVTANQAVAWYSAQSATDRDLLRYEHMQALLQAGRANEAAALLPGSCPDGYQGLNCLGWTGVLAARRGDTTVAHRFTRIIEGLELRPRALQAEPPYWLSAIAGAEGRLDHAVERLRLAFSRGAHYGVWHHGDPLLASLRGHPGFKELLRPKG